MTLVEFLHPLKSKPMRDNVLACLFYLHKKEDVESATVEELRSKLKSGRVKNSAKSNLADVLSKSAPMVHCVGHSGSKMLWALTQSGEKSVRDTLDIPAEPFTIQHQLTSLDILLKKISDPEILSYVNEAITCLKVDARRAAVVFLWVGSIRIIQKILMNTPTATLNISISKFYPKAKQIRRIEDFCYINESTQLLAAEDVGLFDKNQRAVLEECLNLRNKCGHPGKYNPGVNKVSGFIEDLLQIALK
jgi:hypothetical protein